MMDWSENSPSPESVLGYIAWHQTQKDSQDIYEDKDTINEVEMAYFLDEDYQGKGYANEALCKVVERAGFELFEKRTPIGHKQPNMESDSYFYYRKYRS